MDNSPLAPGPTADSSRYPGPQPYNYGAPFGSGQPSPTAVQPAGYQSQPWQGNAAQPADYQAPAGARYEPAQQLNYQQPQAGNDPLPPAYYPANQR